MRGESTYDISPEILSFMRKSSGMSEDDIAKKLKISKSNYIAIENGAEEISEKELISLADLYKRPLIAFYEADISNVLEMPHDYRLNRDKKLSPQVFFAKRKALYLAEELTEITNRTTVLPIINTNVPASELAEKVQILLEVDFDFLKRVVERKEETALGYYKSLIEEKFFIPIIEHPLKSSGVRAFSVLDHVCVIVLNESDLNEVKLFSLLHEFCHLLKRHDGICSIDIEKDRQQEEKYCDEFAATLLMPENFLRKRLTNKVESMKQVENIAKQFGVSKLVTLIRMKKLNIINQGQYVSFKKRLDASPRAGFGKRNWEQTYIKRTSRLVLNNLLDAFRRGDLTYTSLSTITGIKDKYLQRFI